ncbi:MAG: ABC-type transport auxiliary lipoprotein family protein [Alphaproteobacteria bacterium]
MIKRPVPSLMAALLCTLFLAGCANVIPGRGVPPKLFSLSPKSTYSAGLPTVNWQLVVEVPITAETLDTARIALSRDRYTLDFYGNARWAERAPMMIQTLLVESFENTEKIVAVARQATDLRADYVLKTDLREFQAELSGDGRPTVRVRINAKLVKMPERIIIASFKSERAVEAESSNLIDVVRAFDTALGKVLKQVVEWALMAPGG